MLTAVVLQILLVGWTRRGDRYRWEIGTTLRILHYSRNKIIAELVGRLKSRICMLCWVCLYLEVVVVVVYETIG